MQNKGPTHWILLNLEEMGTTLRKAQALCNEAVITVGCFLHSGDLILWGQTKSEQEECDTEEQGEKTPPFLQFR